MGKIKISVVLFAMLLAVLLCQHLAYAADCGLVPSALQAQISADEPWYCPINQQIYQQWAGDLPIAGIAVTIAFAIAAIITMVGIALKSDRIRNFGIGELYEAVASAMIVFAFLYVCAVMFGIIPALLVGNINPFATAFNLITTTAQQINAVNLNYFNQMMSFGFIASISTDITIITGSTRVTLPSELLQPLYLLPLQLFVIDPLQTLGVQLADGLGALWAEYYLLVFFSAASIPVFLVPGVVLRAIFPTRALGGMLIALAIGFYLVMPTMFAVAFYFTAPGVSQALETAAIQSSRFAGGTDVSGLSATSPVVMQMQSTQTALSSFWLLIFFYPLFIIAITYAFVTQTAQLIGGAASTTGGRMRGLV